MATIHPSLAPTFHANPDAASAPAQAAPQGGMGPRSCRTGTVQMVMPTARGLAVLAQAMPATAEGPDGRRLLDRLIRPKVDARALQPGRGLPDAMALFDLGQALSRLAKATAAVERAKERVEWAEVGNGAFRAPLLKREAACQRRVDQLTDAIVQQYGLDKLGLPPSSLYPQPSGPGSVVNSALAHLDRVCASQP